MFHPEMIDPSNMIFNLQHVAFLKGIPLEITPDKKTLLQSPESLFKGSPERLDIKKWQNFIDGDSTLDIITGLNDAFRRI